MSEQLTLSYVCWCQCKQSTTIESKQTEAFVIWLTSQEVNVFMTHDCEMQTDLCKDYAMLSECEIVIHSKDTLIIPDSSQLSICFDLSFLHNIFTKK